MVKPKKGKHMPVCFDESGSHAGEMHTTGSKKKAPSSKSKSKPKKSRFERALD